MVKTPYPTILVVVPYGASRRNAESRHFAKSPFMMCNIMIGTVKIPHWLIPNASHHLIRDFLIVLDSHADRGGKIMQKLARNNGPWFVLAILP